MVVALQVVFVVLSAIVSIPVQVHIERRKRGISEHSIRFHALSAVPVLLASVLAAFGSAYAPLVDDWLNAPQVSVARVDVRDQREYGSFVLEVRKSGDEPVETFAAAVTIDGRVTNIENVSRSLGTKGKVFVERFVDDNSSFEDVHVQIPSIPSGSHVIRLKVEYTRQNKRGDFSRSDGRDYAKYAYSWLGGTKSVPETVLDLKTNKPWQDDRIILESFAEWMGPNLPTLDAIFRDDPAELPALLREEVYYPWSREAARSSQSTVSAQ